MAILNFTGFEAGTNANQGNGGYETQPFAGGACSYDTGTVRTGTYSLKIDKVLTDFGGVRLPSTFNSDGTVTVSSGSFADLYIQSYFRYSVAPTLLYEEIIEVIGTDGTPIAALCFDNAGKLSIYNYNGAIFVQVAIGATVLSTNTWYKINLKITAGGSGAYELKIDEAAELSGSNSWTNTNNCMNSIIGASRDINGQSMTVFFDDCIMSDSSFITTDYGVKVIKPNANGSTMSWTAGGSPQDYTQVDDIPRGDVTSAFVLSPTTGNPNVALFDMEDCATVGITGTIHSLRAVTQMREASSGTSASKIRVHSGATDSDSSTRNGTTTATGQNRLLNTDPDTGVAWTLSGIDAVEIGAVENNAIGTRLGNAMGYVLYSPAAAATNTNFLLMF